MKKKIVCDDELDSIYSVMKVLIDKTNISISVFNENPEEIIKAIKDNHYDAAFLDYYMPKINGLDLARKLIEADNNIKILFISGYNYEKEQIVNELKDNLLGFLDKPVSEHDMISVLNKLKEINICIKTFGSFDLIVDNKPILFPSKKSKELLALLVDRNGKTVSMEEVICALWPDVDIEKSKILYRDSVWKLRKTLKDNGILNLVNFNRALLNINKIIKCDYRDYLDNKNDDFVFDYMNNYEWSLDTQYYLSKIKNKKC